MTTAHELFILQPAVERLQEARRIYNLRDPAERRAWQRIAYESRVDFGEEPQLKPGFHEDETTGWMD